MRSLINIFVGRVGVDQFVMCASCACCYRYNTRQLSVVTANTCHFRPEV